MADDDTPASETPTPSMASPRPKKAKGKAKPKAPPAPPAPSKPALKVVCHTKDGPKPLDEVKAAALDKSTTRDPDRMVRAVKPKE